MGEQPQSRLHLRERWVHAPEAGVGVAEVAGQGSDTHTGARRRLQCQQRIRAIDDAFLRHLRLDPAGGAQVAHGLLEAEPVRSEEHTSELQSLMRNSYAV